MQILNVENIGTDHSTVEQRCEIEEEGQCIPIFRILPADDVGGQRSKKQACQRADRCDENGYTICPYYLLRRLEDDLIGFQREFSRPE